MNGAGAKTFLLCVLALGLVAGARVAAWPIVRVELPARAEAPTRDVQPAPRVAVESLTAATITHDPFRFTRRPAATAYDPLRVGQPVAPPQPKPVLALVGVVWDGGRDPTALIEGLPGVDGPRVVRNGEPFGELRVKRIERARVVIVGMDTVWVLTVRETWR